MLRHFLGILDPDIGAASARWIRSNQRDDGTWGTFHGGPADLSTTVEAYVGAAPGRRRGPDRRHMRRAAAWVRAHGGIAATRVFTRIWLAMVGAWSWEDLPVVPPEILYLPASVPAQHLRLRMLGPPDGGRPHRRHGPPPRPGRCLSASPSCGASRPAAAGPPRRPSTSAGGAARATRPTRSTATNASRRGSPLARCSGASALAGPSAGSSSARRRTAVGRHPAAGRLLDHRPSSPGLPPRPPGPQRGARRARCVHHRRRCRGRRLEACQSPVWDTALAVIGPGRCRTPTLSDPAHPVRGQVAPGQGDHGHRRLGGAPARAGPGRLGLRVRQRQLSRHRRHRRGGAGPAERPPVRLGPSPTPAPRAVALDGRHAEPGRRLGSLRRRQRQQPGRRSCPSATSARSPTPPRPMSPPTWWRCWPTSRVSTPAVIDRGIRWLWDHQEPDGSWFGRWGVNYVYGTGAVVPALVAAGVDPGDRASDGPSPGWRTTRTRTAAGVRTCARTATTRGGGAGHSTRLADGLGSAGPHSCGTSPARTASRGVATLLETQQTSEVPGTSRGSPAPAFPGTSRSTTTCTGWCGRSAPSAVTAKRWRGDRGT